MGIAQRCLRALGNLKKKGIQGIESAIEKGKRVLRSVKEHHLFVKGKEEKEKILTRLIEETEHLMEEATRVVESIKESADMVKQRAAEKLTTMKEVATQLIPQIIQWMKTGVVARGRFCMLA